MDNELLFQFIWQHALFQPVALKTSTGERVTVQHCGKPNKHSGPDFEEAKIRIGGTLLVGNVELHLKTSDWYQHRHQYDKAYDNIILHVVYEHDIPWSEEAHIPLLELRHHIAPEVLLQYKALQHTKQPIPCAAYLTQIKSLTKIACLTRLLAERWEMKFAHWEALLLQNKNDWRVLLYWQLAANFGFKTNAIPFLALAQSLPLTILGRHHKNLFQIEALFFGQAGMLSQDFSEEYPYRLQQEYKYLSKKYRLQPIDAKLWRFMRLRPANFPSLRIAQFAALVHQSLHLFTQIVSSVSLKELSQLFELSASSYWDSHYRFEVASDKSMEKRLGTESIRNIIINTIAPLRFLYTHTSGIGKHCEDAVQLLEQLPAEKNNITTAWEALDWMPENAAQSQAQIQLFNQYCSHKRCLNCSIGHSVMHLRP